MGSDFLFDESEFQLLLFIKDIEWDKGPLITLGVVMKIYIKPSTLKNQTKILVKSWPGAIKSTHARKILCMLYGYKDSHHYKRNVSKENPDKTREVLNENLYYFIQRLAFLGELDHNESFTLLKELWPVYITSRRFFEHTCDFQFHGELNDFLLYGQRETSINYEFNNSPSVKDSIEALGVPHPEVELIKVNGRFEDFSYQIGQDDEVEVYPWNSNISANDSNRISIYHGTPRFVLDVHLGTLARYLRMAGFDTWYKREDKGDQFLSEISRDENRIMLSRDIGLLKRSNVNYGRFVRNTDPKLQFEEIVSRYGLKGSFIPFKYCISCNSTMGKIPKESIKDEDRVPESVLKYHTSFKRCNGCGKIFWKGSHYDKMSKFLDTYNL